MDEKEQPAIVSLVVSVGSANLFQGCGRTGRESDGKWRKGKKKKKVGPEMESLGGEQEEQVVCVRRLCSNKVVLSAVCSRKMVSSGA